MEALQFQEVRTILADCLVAVGRWDEASEVVSDGLAWRDDGLAGTLLRLTRIDLATVRERVPQGHFRICMSAAELAWWRSDPAASRAHAADGLARAGLVADPYELGQLALSLVRASRVVSTPDPGIPTPDDVIALLSTRAGHPVVDAWLATATATMAEGEADAAQAWEAARSAWQDLDRSPMIAVASWRAGVAHDAGGDGRTSRTRLAEAQELAEGLSAVPLAVEARAARSVTGAGPGADAAVPSEPVPTVPGHDQVDVGIESAVEDLTERETQVLVLGLNNGIFGVAEASATAATALMTSSFTGKVSVAPDTFLVSTIWDFEVAYGQAIEGIQAGETSGVVPMNPESGLITLGELHNVPDDVATQVTDLWNQVVAGEVDVPVLVDEVVVP